MPNTVIQLKKSSTPSSTPSDLANGELAINFADGKLFYKNTAGFIAHFSGTDTNSFGTVNVNGTLVVSDTPGDIISLIPGTGISLTGDAINDTITITATGNAVASFDAANVSNSIAIAAFAKANAALANTSGIWFNGNLNIGTATSNVFLGDTIVYANLGSAVSNSNSGFVINQTWNNAAQAFTAFRINVANTNSATASLLFDVRQDNASTFYVKKYTGTQGEIGINSNGGIWDLRVVGNEVNLIGSISNHNVRLPGANFYRSAVGYGIELGSSGGSIIYSGTQEAANTIGQRRGTAGQAYRLYGTYTDASNYERLSFSANTTGHYIIGEEAGTGSARPLYLGTNNAPNAVITSNGRVRIGTSFSSSAAALLHVSDAGDAGSINDAHYSSTFNYQMVVGSSISNADDNNAIVLGSGSFGNNPIIRFKASTGNKGYVGWAGGASNFFVGTHDGKQLRLRANNTDVLIVGNNQSVGIGTTNPTSNLHVIGTANITSNLVVQGNVGIGTASPGYKLEVNGSFAATTKSFVIKHPTKKGMKLRYGSLEGPENGVYIRGRLTNDNTIVLPDYWHKLVDKDSISVMLTPIGKTKQPSVGKITSKKIQIIGNDIDCFYHIFAERKDVDKLVVEINE